MTTNVTDAKDAMLAQFNSVWSTDPLTSAVPVGWPNIKFTPPAGSESDGDAPPWARVTILHNPGAGGQATLSGDTGQRRYERFGIITVQIFTAFGGGLDVAMEHVRVAMRAFEGVRLSPTGVVFRNTRFVEVGQDGAWLQTNVTTEFEYAEVR